MKGKKKPRAWLKQLWATGKHITLQAMADDLKAQGKAVPIDTLKKYSAADKWQLARTALAPKIEAAALARMPQDLAARRAKWKMELDQLSRDMLEVAKRELKRLKKSKRPEVGLEGLVKLARQAAELQEKALGGLEPAPVLAAPAGPTGESPAAAAIASSVVNVIMPGQPVPAITGMDDADLEEIIRKAGAKIEKLPAPPRVIDAKPTKPGR